MCSSRAEPGLAQSSVVQTQHIIKLSLCLSLSIETSHHTGCLCRASLVKWRKVDGGNIFLPTMQCSMLKSWSENIFKGSLICKLILPLDHSMIEPLLSYSFWKEESDSFFLPISSQPYCMYLFSFFPDQPNDGNFWFLRMFDSQEILSDVDCWVRASQGRRTILTTGVLFLFLSVWHSGTVWDSPTRNL